MMTCPTCGHHNPPENHYCGDCGTALHPGAILISRPSSLRINSGQLPAPQVKYLVATLAVSVAAMLAEIGLVYLQRRVTQMERPSLSLRRRKTPAAQEKAIVPAQRPGGRVITVVSERVVEEKRWGRPVRRVVERFAWRGEERRGD